MNGSWSIFCQLKEWPQFRVELGKVEGLQPSFLREVGTTDGLLKGWNDDLREWRCLSNDCGI